MAQGRPTNEPGNYFALGKQSAKDSEATTFYFFKHLDGTGFEIGQDVTAEREGGDGQEVGLRYKTRVFADGQIVCNARQGAAARVFAWCLGQDTVASNAAGQDHTANPVASVPYLTAEQQWADEIERDTNVQLTGFTLSGEAGRPLKLAPVQFVGGGTIYQRDTASSLTVTRETVPPVFYPGASVQIDGAGNTKVTKFEVQVARNVDTDIQTVTLFREDVVPLNFDVMANFTLKYESRTLYQKIQYQSGSYVALDLSTGSFEVFTANGSQTLRAVLPFLQYVDAKVNKLDPDGKTVYIDVAAAGLKNATYQIFTVVRDSVNATVAY